MNSFYYNLFAVFFSICLPLLFLVKPLIKTGAKNILKENKFEIALYLIFVISFLTRTVLIDKFPVGLNIDEASAGYEAYAISTYGYDRNGNWLPVFLCAVHGI